MRIELKFFDLDQYEKSRNDRKQRELTNLFSNTREFMKELKKILEMSI